MSSIADRATATVFIPAGRVLTVSGDAVVTVSGSNVKVIGSRDFGPYATDSSVSVSAVSGVSYSLSPTAVSASAVDVLYQSGQLVTQGGASIDSVQQVGVALKLPKLHAALCRVMSGSGQAFIGVIGDSTTVGAGAGTGGKGLIAARAGSPTSQLVSRLNGIGIPASDDSWFGEHLIEAFQGVTRAQYDTKFTVGGSAAYYPDGSFQTVGGIPFRLNSTGKSVSFTPTYQTDTAKFFYFNNLAGTVDCNFAGGASLGTVTGTGASSIGSSTKTYTKGAGTFTISWSAGNSAVVGAVCYDSTTPRVNVLNLGCYGDKLTSTNGYANNPNYWRGGAALSVLGLDAVVVDMTINSANQDGAAGVQAYKTALMTICQDVLNAGADLILATPHAINTTPQTSGVVSLYIQAIRDVAATFNAPIIDLQTVISSPSTFAAFYFDTLHLTSSGYRSKACLYSKLLASTAGI